MSGALPADLDDALAVFAAAPVRVVALDFDGVLAPIVATPADAAPLPEAMRALRRLAGRRDVRLGLVSGRAVADPALRRAAVPTAVLVGSHGAERAVVEEDGRLTVVEPELDDDQAALLDRLRAEAARLVEQTPGAWMEDKPTAVVVHTRPVADAGVAAALEQRTLDELGGLAGVRAIAGKRVVELTVAAATKGDAVGALRTGFDAGDRRSGAPPVLYAGDDVTDEDAFAVLGDTDLGIKVGDGPTRARYRVADPAALAAVLGRLADLADAR